MSQAFRAAAGVVLAVVLTVSLSAVPVLAVDGEVRLEIATDAVRVASIVIDRDTGRVRQDFNVKVETVADRRYVVADISPNDLYCEGTASPAPTYSWSNHTLHWGAKIICNFPAEGLRIRMSLWSGPNTDIFADDAPFRTGAGYVYSYPARISRCLDWGGFTYWELLIYCEIKYGGVWQQFTPYPVFTPPRWQECLEVQPIAN